VFVSCYIVYVNRLHTYISVLIMLPGMSLKVLMLLCLLVYVLMLHMCCCKWWYCC